MSVLDNAFQVAYNTIDYLRYPREEYVSSISENLVAILTESLKALPVTYKTRIDNEMLNCKLNRLTSREEVRTLKIRKKESVLHHTDSIACESVLFNTDSIVAF